MANVLTENRLTEAQAGEKMVSSIAMIMVLVSFTMLFATLFLGYYVFRLTADVWPPMGMEGFSLYYPTVSTVLIVISSLCFYLYERAFVKADLGTSKTFFGISVLFGLLFVACQFKLWAFLKSSGIYAGSSIFASIIYGFTWIHAAHIVAGLLCLAWLIPTLRENVEIGRYIVRVGNVGKFWHFLGLIWLIMYLTIFVF